MVRTVDKDTTLNLEKYIMFDIRFIAKEAVTKISRKSIARVSTKYKDSKEKHVLLKWQEKLGTARVWLVDVKEVDFEVKLDI